VWFGFVVQICGHLHMQNPGENLSLEVWREIQASLEDAQADLGDTVALVDLETSELEVEVSAPVRHLLSRLPGAVCVYDFSYHGCTRSGILAKKCAPVSLSRTL